MLDILNYFFGDALHYIMLCILIILVCPWHWTATKKHIFEVRMHEKKQKEEEVIHGSLQ